MRQHPKPVFKKLLCAVALSCVLSGCSEARLASHAFKKFSGSLDDPKPFKVGAPYKINGEIYTPRINMGYFEEGIASWYGPDFHGKYTANGEVYNKYDMTAAHKTLPLPSIVKVTNLENGRSIKVRVNDRGPFVDDRIIDMSYASAKELDMIARGTARVQVELLQEETLALYNKIPNAPEYAQMFPKPAPKPHSGIFEQPVLIAQAGAEEMPPSAYLPELETSRPKAVVVAALEQPQAETGKGIFVQAGAFSNQNNAWRVRDYVKTVAPYNLVEVSPTVVGGQSLYRVRVGPLPSERDARQLLSRVVQGGNTSAKIIYD